MKKLYDATVVVGEYVDKNGNTKKKYMTVGTVFKGDNGLSMKMLKAFSPAGVPDKDGSGEIWVNFYEPKEKPTHGDSAYKAATGQTQGANPKQGTAAIDDDIPF